MLYINVRKSPNYGAVGIKNSWKYEKDLIIIFNSKKTSLAIPKVANYLVGG